ncbi:MAG: DUF3592 domain-containing protein [Lentisphaeria bacterium]|nr:DUF3592 domain-containing protein [Lentisphaeria bacterium]
MARSLKTSSVSFQSEKLHFSRHYVKVIPHLINYIFFGMFAVAGLIAAVLFFSQTEVVPKILCGAVGVIFSLIGWIGMFSHKFFPKAEIDLINKKFYPKGKKKYLSSLNRGEMLEIPLEEFKFLRILKKIASHDKGGTYECYELNIVINEDNRYNILNHGNLKNLHADGMRLAKILNLPLLNENNEQAIFDENEYFKECRSGNIILFCFGLFFFVFGSFFAFHLAVKPLVKYFDSASWERVPAIVTQSQVLTKYDGDHGKLYALNICYSYNFNNQTYQANNYDFFRHGDNYTNIGEEDFYRIKADYPIGKKFEISVNPNNPQEAVIERIIVQSSVWVIIFCLIFPLIGLAIIIGALKGLIKSRPKEMENEKFY